MEDAQAQVREIVERRKSNDFDPRLERVRGSYCFDVENVGAFLMRVDHGKVEVAEGGGEADCTIRSSPEDFVRIATGEQNLITAYMQGRIEFRGDLGLAQKLHGFLPRGSQAGGVA
jgi:putative sterol carrier protein